MKSITPETNPEEIREKIKARAGALFDEQHREMCVQTDRTFAGLMIFQWVAGLVAAQWISPKAWAGSTSATHPHVWGALFVGAAITSLPFLLALRRPGEVFTRHVMAAGQMLMSALLIHLSGGRIETHFHIFGSLAFLAFYRDWRVLLTATVVVLADHVLRGIFYPESVFGVLSAPVWRAFEHAGWVAFEDFFLVIYVQRSLREMRSNAGHRAQLEGTNAVIELAVTTRTAQLAAANASLEREVAERTQAEEALRYEMASRREAQLAAEHANKELSEFAYVVSHDLKAPLRGIGSLAAWLHKDYAHKLDADGREQLELMLGRVNRMNGLIDGILAYSRAGRAREGEMDVDLGRLVPNAIDLLAPPSHIRTEVVTALPSVKMEPTKAQQLFQNLLSNAIKYMDKPQGHVRVSCIDEDQRFWRFSVADNGPGIEQKYFERIFQLFQTLAPRDSVEGTGVGLALVKKIVELEGGRIWVESTPGTGTTFHFTLPKALQNSLN
jgi:signal transduction histidine kinase